MQGVLSAAAHDHQESVCTPAPDKVGRPYCISQGSSQHLQDGSGSDLPVTCAELAEIGKFETDDGKGNLKLAECSQQLPQVRVHHHLIRQAGGVVEAAVLSHVAVVWAGTTQSKFTFKSLNDADERAVFVAQGDCPGMHLRAVA